MGRSYQIEIVKIGLERVDFKNKFHIPQQLRTEGTEVLRDWYIKKAKERIIPRVKRIARDLGVNYSAAKIVDNRFRWGSCTPKNNVNLNWRLIKAPMFVIDYVIGHELAHLIEPNHNDRFWNIVRTHNPNAEKAKAYAELKHAGQIHGTRPFTTHLGEVVGALHEFGHLNDDLTAAAWLHDVVEDTPVTIEEIYSEFFQEIWF